MRVAIVVDSYKPDVSGVVNTTLQIEKHLLLKGIEFKIFCPGDPKSSDDTHHYFKGNRFWFYDRMNISLILYPTFKQAMKEYNPKIIHVITEGPLGLHAARFAREEKIPYITNYTTDLPLYTQYYTFDILKPLMEKYLRHVHSESKITLAPSHHSLTQLESIGIKEHDLWQRGIDTDLFFPLEGRQLASKKKLLYVGRIAVEKSIHVLMDMAELLNERGFDYEFNIVGDGPQLEEIKQRNIPNVNFLGFRTGEELRMLYRSHDVFMFSSESETFGNVILEAMASGLPCISVFAGGVKENIKDGENAIAIYYNEAPYYADAVEKLFRDEEEYWRLSRNAREYTLTKSWTKLIDRLIEIYQSVIS